MSEPAELAAPAAPVAPESAVEELARSLGIGEATARALVASGRTTPESVRRLPPAALAELGIEGDDLVHLRTAAEAHAAAPPAAAGAATPHAAVDGEHIVSRWLDTVRKSDRPKRRRVPLPAKDSTDVLRKWVDGDDRAMEAWIQASESNRTVGAVSAPPAPVPPTIPLTPPGGPSAEEAPGPTPPEGPAPAEGPSTGSPVVAPPAAPGLPPQLIEREETVVRWLTGLLDRVKSDSFDPHSLLQEVQELQRQLFEERAQRKQLEDEVEHVKRGSIAVIKYVRSREARAREQAVQAKDAEIAELRLRLLQGGGAPEGPVPEESEGEERAPRPADLTTLRELEGRIRTEYQDREGQYVERETELRRRIVQLEGEVRNLRSESEVIRQRERMLALDEGSLPKNLDDRLKAFDARERELLVRENELRTRFEEIRLGTEELERRRAPLTFKEKELGAWEQQLQTTKQALELEARRLEGMRTEEGQIAAASPALLAKEKQVEDLKLELARREEELRSRETFLHQKMEELETLQRKAAQYEADEIHTDAVASATEAKVHTGVRRLDDLLFGGLPHGAQVLLSGPSHTGKDVLARLFVAEGLKGGIPALWVVTDKTYTQIREEMAGLLPAYPDYEERGLVRYVDLYSRSLGVTQAEPNVRLLALTEKNAMDQLVSAVNNFSQELKEKAPTYRLVFETVSTLTAYLDTSSMFRILQPFVGRRKLDNAAAYYALETGMHSESDLQTLEHMVDGSINLKLDQLKTFLSVKGITDAQSRAWVGYTFSKRSFSLGSFSLDHIR